MLNTYPCTHINSNAHSPPPHHLGVSLCSRETTAAQNAENKYLQCPAQFGIFTTQLLYLRIRKHLEDKAERLKVTKAQDICVIVPSKCDREVTLMKSQQHGCLSKTQTMRTPITYQYRLGKFHGPYH